MGGESTSIKAERIGTMRVQTSAYGLPLALAYGRTRITGNLMWYGDFKATAHTQESGGKGGGGVSQTTYTYQAAVAMGLCEGPISEVRAVWKGKERVGDAISTVSVGVTITAPYTVTLLGAISGLVQVYFLPFNTRPQLVRSNPGPGQYAIDGNTLIFNSTQDGQAAKIVYSVVTGGALTKLNLTVFTGVDGQAAWSHLTTNHTDEALNYPGIAYIASPSYQLTGSAALDNHSFEVIGRLPYNAGAGIYDANPKDVLVDLMTNPRYGAGFGALGNLADFSSYCLASGILISPYWADQRPAHEYVTELAQVGNSAPLWSEGKLKLIPYADETVAGALATYTPNITPVYDLTDDDFLPRSDGDPIEVHRRTQADSFNQVQIEFSNRGNDYNPDVADAKDMADIEQHGLRAMQPVKLASVVNPAVAETIANILLNRSLYIRNRYEFSLGWRFALLEPMDVVTLTDAQLGLDRTPVRIVEISEGDDGVLSVIAEELLAGVSAPALYESSIPFGYSANYNSTPGNVAAPVFFEPPISKTTTGLEVWTAVTGAGSNWGGCDVHVSLDGNTYKFVGRVSGGARCGTLKSSMVSGSTATASVRLSGIGGQLLPGTAAEAEALATLCWIGTAAGGEFIAYQGATLVAANEYNLTGLVRGAYGTADGSHAAGQQFVRVDDAIIKSAPLDLSMIGKTIWFKFTSFNVYGGGAQTLDEVTAWPYTINGSMAKLPPSDVTGFAAATSFDRVELAWEPVPDADLAEYEVRSGVVWSTGPVVARVRANKIKLAPQVAGSHTWMVRAIDRFGNYSTNATATTLTVQAPSAVSASGSISGKDYTLAWTPADAAYGIDHYEVRYGGTWETGTLVASASTLSLTAAVDWLGSRTFWVAAVDLAGNVGASTSAEVVITPPSAPLMVAEVIDNNVLLRWQASQGTLPIDHYEIRRGASWSTADVVGTVSALFTVLFESAGGVYTYWIAGVDSAGNVGATYSLIATVSQPPDYILYTDQDSAFTGTKTGIVDDNGAMLLPINTTETWEQHFTNRGWDQPQDQVDAGYPIYAQPAGASAEYEEVIDYGTTLASTKVTLTVDVTHIAGAVSIIPTISVSNDSATGPWTDYMGQFAVYAANFRWVKIRLQASSSGVDLARITRINLKLDYKLRNDAGMGYADATDSGGTPVNFNVQFVDVNALTVTPQGTSGVIAVYDFVDSPYPTSFKVLLFNTSGDRVSGSFSWSAKGV